MNIDRKLVLCILISAIILYIIFTIFKMPIIIILSIILGFVIYSGGDLGFYEYFLKK